MQAPEPIREHPNATFVVGTSPFAILLGYVLSWRGVTLPEYVVAPLGAWLAAAALVFSHQVKRAGAAVWEFGVVGCCRRVWRGAPPT